METRKQLLGQSLSQATLLALFSAFSLQLSAVLHAAQLGTGFTYQGRLTDGGPPANGVYDFEFTLFDAASGGNHVAPMLPVDSVGVTNGLFTVALDFGPGVFLGEERWLEIAVRTSGVGGFARFPGRQLLSPAPYALHAAQSGIAASVAGNSVTAQGLNTPVPPAAGQVLLFDGTSLVWTNSTAAGGSAWLLNGNTNTTPTTHFLGTTDNQPLEFKVNGQRALRLERNEITGDPTVYGLTPTPNIIGGSWLNSVASNVVGATIAGGGAQQAFYYSTAENKVEADFGTIAGGVLNRIGTFGTNAALGGGFLNRIAGRVGTIAGGQANLIETNAAFAAIGGGLQNDVQASAGSAAIGGGSYNSIAAAAINCAIAGGCDNNIGAGTDSGAIGGGRDNAVTASFGTISGGRDNLAGGQYSQAGGRRAKANHTGAFVWADSTDADFASTANNQFSVRANGGVVLQGGGGGAAPQLTLLQTANDYCRLRLGSSGFSSWDISSQPSATPELRFFNGTANRMALDYNGNLTIGGTLAQGSDRNAKENLAPVNPQTILAKVAALPMAQWNFKQEAVRHLGPMAQDFHAAFGVGADDKHIATVDADGVALAAIQGLNQKVEDRSQRSEVRSQELEAENAALRKELTMLERRLAAIEQLLGTSSK